MNSSSLINIAVTTCVLIAGFAILSILGTWRLGMPFQAGAWALNLTLFALVVLLAGMNGHSNIDQFVWPSKRSTRRYPADTDPAIWPSSPPIFLILWIFVLVNAQQTGFAFLISGAAFAGIWLSRQRFGAKTSIGPKTQILVKLILCFAAMLFIIGQMQLIAQLSGALTPIKESTSYWWLVSLIAFTVMWGGLRSAVMVQRFAVAASGLLLGAILVLALFGADIAGDEFGSVVANSGWSDLNLTVNPILLVFLTFVAFYCLPMLGATEDIRSKHQISGGLFLNTSVIFLLLAGIALWLITPASTAKSHLIAADVADGLIISLLACLAMALIFVSSSALLLVRTLCPLFYMLPGFEKWGYDKQLLVLRLTLSLMVFTAATLPDAIAPNPVWWILLGLALITASAGPVQAARMARWRYPDWAGVLATLWGLLACLAGIAFQVLDIPLPETILFGQDLLQPAFWGIAGFVAGVVTLIGSRFVSQSKMTAETARGS